MTWPERAFLGQWCRGLGTDHPRHAHCHQLHCRQTVASLLTPKLSKPQADKEFGAGDCSLPHKGAQVTRTAPGSYIICGVRFKCHCCRGLTRVPTQWAVRGAYAASSSSWR